MTTVFVSEWVSSESLMVARNFQDFQLLEFSGLWKQTINKHKSLTGQDPETTIKTQSQARPIAKTKTLVQE